VTPERYADVFTFPVSDYYRLIGFDFSRETFETVGSEFMAGYEARRLECRLQPGAREALERAAERGLEQSVLSGYRQDTLEELLAHGGLRGFFQHVVGSDDHYARGKAAHAFRWLRQSGAEPGRTLLVGDTVHDWEVARAIGADCVLIPCGHNARPRLAACGVPMLDSLAELR
jgi:phosphoglycolate phosphatase